MAVLKHYARNFIKISQIELIMLGFVKLSNFSHRKIIFFHDRKATFTTTNKEDINRPVHVYLVLL